MCEYPLAITAGIVGLYALTPGVPGLVRRALAYGGGLAAGVAPLLAYQWWAFGSPLHLAYANAVAKTGFSGHAEIGLNDGGFFGITLPRPDAALELLFSGRGLLTLAPVLVMAIAGVVALRREGRHRAEANTIGAIALAYFVYNAGYWLPLGGGSPGPRFLIPILPFLVLGLAVAWRRWPAVTLALTAISATTMVAATMSHPMIGVNDPGVWIDRMVEQGLFQHSVLDLAGVAHGLLAIAPFAVGIVIALALGVSSLGRASLRAARAGPPRRGRLGRSRPRSCRARGAAVGWGAGAHRRRRAHRAARRRARRAAAAPAGAHLSAGRRARPCRAACARGSGLAANGLTRVAAGCRVGYARGERSRCARRGAAGRRPISRRGSCASRGRPPRTGVA